MVISKHYVTPGALSETVMSFHDHVLPQGSPGSAKRILWVLLHIGLLSSFVSINCEFNGFFKYNSPLSNPVCSHIGVCMSASLVLQCLITRLPNCVSNGTEKGIKILAALESDSFHLYCAL